MESQPKSRKNGSMLDEDVVTQVQQLDAQNMDEDQTPLNSSLPVRDLDDYISEPGESTLILPKDQVLDDDCADIVAKPISRNEATKHDPEVNPLETGVEENATTDAAVDLAGPVSAAGDTSPSLDRGSATLTGSCGSPSGPELASEAAETVSSAVGPRLAQQHATERKLQEAIEKVEQLDRSLEKKFKEHLEARSVTSDLQALIRRELAELSCRASRRETREETDNTLRFLRVLVDDDSESDTSSQVTPIFQTQVRIGARPPPAENREPADAAGGPLSVSARRPPPQFSSETLGGATGDGREPARHAADDFFIRRNIQLAQELGGSLAMTEEERRRLEQLLTEDDEPENAFSIDESSRRLMHSLDDQLSSMGVSCSWPPASLPPASSEGQTAGSAAGDGGAGGGEAADGGNDGEPDYLQVTREDREMMARMEEVERRLDQLREPLEVLPLERGDVDSMIQEAISALVAAPRADLRSSTSKTCSLAAPSSCETTSCGLASAPTEPASGDGSSPSSEAESSDSESSDESEPPTPAGSEGGSRGGSARTESAEPVEPAEPAAAAPSEVHSEATVDLRSALGGRRADNARQLAAELRPGSPSAWLVDVDRGPQRFQLVVPRLCRKVLSGLLEGAAVRTAAAEEQRSPSAGGDAEPAQPSAA